MKNICASYIAESIVKTWQIPCTTFPFYSNYIYIYIYIYIYKPHSSDYYNIPNCKYLNVHKYNIDNILFAKYVKTTTLSLK